jgi:hypothetical protein
MQTLTSATLRPCRGARFGCSLMAFASEVKTQTGKKITLDLPASWESANEVTGICVRCSSWGHSRCCGK